MKTNFLKIFFLIFILSFSVCFAIDKIKKNAKFKEIAKGLYLDINSLSKGKDAASGWFKKENDNGIELTKIRSYCDIKVLEIIETKTYDKNHKLIEHYKNDNPVGCDYEGLVDGEIYYKVLCGN